MLHANDAKGKKCIWGHFPDYKENVVSIREGSALCVPDVKTVA